MTDPDPFRVLLLLAESENSRLIRAWFEGEPSYEVVTGDHRTVIADGAFDICLVDLPTLRAIGEQVAAGKRSVEPVFLPVLLVIHSQYAADASEVLARLPDELAAPIDDVIIAPVRRLELHRRIESLRRSRRFSLELAESRERYRRLVDLTPEAVLRLRGGTVSYVNAAGCELVGAGDESDVVGRPLGEFVQPSDRERLERYLSDLSPVTGTGPSPLDDRQDDSGDVEFVEVELRTVTGGSVSCELAGVRVDREDAGTGGDGGDPNHGGDASEGESIQIVIRDVSVRNAREERLNLYRRAMDEATVGITITDPQLPDNPLVYLNDAFEELTGCSREQSLGRNPRFVQHENTDPETVAAIREAIDSEEALSVEVLNGHADGSKWWNALDITPVRNEDGVVTNFVGFQRDVTTRREREQRLAVLDRVLRHNLRNRMNVVLGHASDIAELTDDADVVSRSEEITHAVESLLALSEDARRFRSALEPKATAPRLRDVVEIASDVVSDLETSEADVEIRTDFPASAPALVHDSIAVAIEELLTNAIEHCDCSDPEVSMGVRVADGWVDLWVADNGPGIDEDERQALESTEETPTEHATGLGLWLIRWTVDRSGGTVSYEETDPGGSVVTVKLRDSGYETDGVLDEAPTEVSPGGDGHTSRHQNGDESAGDVRSPAVGDTGGYRTVERPDPDRNDEDDVDVDGDGRVDAPNRGKNPYLRRSSDATEHGTRTGETLRREPASTGGRPMDDESTEPRDGS